MRPLFIALGLFAILTPADAQTPMSAAEFDAYATGKTLTYAQSGQLYGVEQYLPGQRVRWAFIDDTCRIGHWYEDAGQICFVYEDDGTPQCWIFALQNGRLTAEFMVEGGGTILTEIGQSPEPMQCAGPDVGV